MAMSCGSDTWDHITIIVAPSIRPIADASAKAHSNCLKDLYRERICGIRGPRYLPKARYTGGSYPG